MTLLRRIVAEKRSLVIPIAVVLFANVVVYAIVVYPLQKKVAGAADRSAAAVKALRTAEHDLSAARALVSGKSRADEALTTFYNKVLPADVLSAQRMTYTRLPELARKTSVKYDRRQIVTEKVPTDARLGRMRISMTLEGEYENFRRFIYDLESSPEFIIIDDVALSQPDPTRALVLTLQLSTYYRVGANGA